MKLTLTLLLFAVIAATANSGYSQNVRIDLKMKDAKLVDVFREIERTSEFGFFFKSEELNLDQRVSIDLKNVSIEDILKKVLSDRYEYRILDKNIVITRGKFNTTEQQQGKSVTGKVSDSAGSPLPGVSVVVKGTTNGTITNGDGSYSLLNVPENATLQFSFVGMKAQEVAVGGKTTVNVTLADESIGLDEVVAVGYSTKKRRDLTGSISSVNAEELSKSKSESFAQALQGNVSGVYVKSNSGQPGGGVSIRIRGIGGLNNSEPLYVIDGVQVVGDQSENYNPLTALNPNDIESMEVLKDASSAAIYGARGANGVVIITTKRGDGDGKAKLSFSGTFGVQNLLNAGNFDVLNASEFAQVVNVTSLAGGGKQIFGGPDTGQYPPEYFPSPSALGAGTSHLNEIFQTAPMQEYQLAVQGGKPKSTYYFSMNYLNQEGIVKTTSFDRVTARFNSDSEIFDFLKIGNSFGLSYSNSTEIQGSSRTDEGGTIGRSLTIAPTIPIFNNDGTYAGPPTAFYPPERTPYALLHDTDRGTTRTGFTGNVYAQINIIKGLSFKTSLGFGLNNSKGEYFSPTYSEGIVSSNVTNVSENYSEGRSYQWSNVLSYNTSLGKNNITALAGFESLESVFSNIIGKATYKDNAIRIVSSTGSLTSNINQYKGSSSMLSYFGNAGYNYDSKYYIEGNIRRDGSSRFGENNRWGIFPSASAAWRISEEGFFNLSFIDDFKLRGSYGEVGNDKIGDFSYIAGIKNVVYAFGGNNGSFSNGQAIDALGNPDLKWETSKQTNFGIDLTMFDGKWTVAAEYFKTDVEDMLLGVPVPATSGISNSTYEIFLATVTANAGSLINKGFEFETSYNNKIGAISYKIGGNLTTYNNEVTSIGDNEQIWGASIQSQNVSRTVVGGSLGEFYGYVVEGIFQTQAEVDAANNLGDSNIPYQSAGTAPGDFRFKDLNGDNLINDKDRDVIGSPVPDFTYGLTFDITYKNFDLSMLWYGVQGADIYHGNRMDLEASGRTNFNKSKTVLDAWSGTNTSNTVPRRISSDPNQNKRVSSVFVEDGSFLALRNISLAYNIPQTFCSKLKLASANVYVSAQNYLVFTKYSGFDPEVGNIGGNNLGAGIDNDFYPRAKTIHLGLSINF